MKVSKRVALGGLAITAAGFSTAALAQMSERKSQSLAKLDEDEMMRVNPRTGSIQKSNAKVSTAMHEAAMSAGGIEIPPTSVIYKHAGKMYMFHARAAANNQAAINFESQFDNDY
jgi:hypothetical protein